MHKIKSENDLQLLLEKYDAEQLFIIMETGEVLSLADLFHLVNYFYLYDDPEITITPKILRVGVLAYDCLKCGKKVELEVRPQMKSGTIKLFYSLFDSKLCHDCHMEESTRKLVECYVH